MFKSGWKGLGFVWGALIIAGLAVIMAAASLSFAAPFSAARAPLLAQASNIDEVKAIASATTVLIAPNFEPVDAKTAAEQTREDFERGSRLGRAGSGVIVARENYSGGAGSYVYYVLTNFHVVEPRAIYGIRTFDKEVHPADYSLPPRLAGQPERPDLTVGNVKKFGTRKPDKNIEGFDLAVIKFESEKEYPVAVIPVSNLNEIVKSGEEILVSGWPTPPAGSTDIRRTRQSSLGKVEGVTSPPPSGGYSLAYDAPVGVGMSGGPVFNMKGEVVGIHGAQQRVDDPKGGWAIHVKDIVEKVSGENISLSPPPVSDSVISKGRENMALADNLSAQEYRLAFDVSPTDPEFQALQSLSERFGCVALYPDGTFRPRAPLTRGEAAVDLNACLNRIVEWKAASIPTVTRADVSSLQQSIKALEQEIQALK
jgi:serine protease Do